jgi:hypothetical protein
MPDEWNAIVASMRAYEGNCMSSKGEQYQDALKDEISEPSGFRDQQPNPQDHVRKQSPTIRLTPQKTDSEQDFKVLCSRFHKPKKPPDLHEKQQGRMS